MFKPKQVAPFFSMTTTKFSDVLREIHIIYPLNQTPLGSFLLQEQDLAIIELYLKTKGLFGNKKITLLHLKEYLEKKKIEEDDNVPDWFHLIQNSS